MRNTSIKESSCYVAGMSCNNINNIIPIDDDDNEIFYSVEKLTWNNDDIILLSDSENNFFKGVAYQTIRERLHYVRFYSILDLMTYTN